MNLIQDCTLYGEQLFLAWVKAPIRNTMLPDRFKLCPRELLRPHLLTLQSDPGYSLCLILQDLITNIIID
jgi:hypothetical protein